MPPLEPPAFEVHFGSCSRGSRPHRWLGAVVLVLSILVFTGCRPEPRADFVIHNGPEVETIDPQILTGQGDGRVAAALFEGLTRFDPKDAHAIPGLAESWELSPDGRHYTFHLRTNAVWSTGQPITAGDFVWSWNHAVLPETGADYAGFFFYVLHGQEWVTATNRSQLPPLGIRASDPFTVEVDLENPTPFFLELCAMRVMSVVPRFWIERYGDQWIRTDPVPCSGAYQLEYWRPNDRIRLRKNPRYWDAAHVQLKVVDMLPGDSASTAVNLFLTGAVDFIADKNSIPTELYDRLADDPRFRRFPYLGNYFIRFNTTRPPFQDPRVRRAMALVIDKRRLVERITRLGETPASGLVPPGVPNYSASPGVGQNALDAWHQGRNPEEQEKAYAAALEANAVEARELLRQAGYPDGKGFRSFSYMFNAGGGGGGKMHEQIGVEVQSMLKEKLGLQMELRPVEWKTYLSDMSRLNYDMIRGSWIGDYADPTTFLDCFTSDNGNNRTGWRNAVYDGWVAKAAATPDIDTRRKILRQAESLLVAEEMPIIPIYYYNGMMAFDPKKFGGIYPTLTDEHPISAIFQKP